MHKTPVSRETGTMRGPRDPASRETGTTDYAPPTRRGRSETATPPRRRGREPARRRRCGPGACRAARTPAPRRGCRARAASRPRPDRAREGLVEGCGRGLGGVAAAPDRGFQAPAHLDRGKDLGEKRRHRETRVSDHAAGRQVDHQPEAVAEGVPVPDGAIQEGGGLLAGSPAPERPVPHRLLFEHCGERIEVVGQRPPQVETGRRHRRQRAASGWGKIDQLRWHDDRW